MAERPYLITLIVAALAGLIFAAFSTYDFVQHLDRQVHDIHCSFVPGLVAGGAEASEGCQVTMMSQYSSVFRSSVWGGIPIALPAMFIFAFLLYRGVVALGGRGPGRKVAAGFLFGAACIPLLATVVMGYIAFAMLGAACKLCIGIYVSSLLVFVAALLAWLETGGDAPATAKPAAAATDAEVDAGEPAPEAPATPLAPAASSSMKTVLLGGVELGAFIVIPMIVYLVLLPDYSVFIGECGELAKPGDPYGVMVPSAEGSTGIPAIEVFDPLCPACRAFDGRLASSGLQEKLDIDLVLFPLDDKCNWMVTKALHPGACKVSEAILCAAGDAAVNVHDVIAWAFENQESIRMAAAADPKATAKLVLEQFSDLKKCLGTPAVRAKLNKSLRWAVSNSLPVLTPQLYVDGVKLCDEDTDLGMDYALSRLIERRGAAGGGK